MRFILAAVLAATAAASAAQSSVLKDLDAATSAALAPYLTGDEATDLQLVELAARTQQHATAYAAAHSELQGLAARLAGQASAGAAWRFGGNYAPQSYGMWKQHQGTWVFGSDRRMECEACNYVLYMLIDRLGDQFSRVTIQQEADLLCPRVQWVFRSACDFIVRKNKEVIADLIMKLIEPLDICKHLTLCPPTPYDLAGVGSMQGFGEERAGSFVPPQYRAQLGFAAGSSAQGAPLGVVPAQQTLGGGAGAQGVPGFPSGDSLANLRSQMEQAAKAVHDIKDFAAAISAPAAAPGAAAAAPAPAPAA